MRRLGPDLARVSARLEPERPSCPSWHFPLPPSFHRWLPPTSTPSWLDRKAHNVIKSATSAEGLARNAKRPEICRLMWQGHFSTWHRGRRPAPKWESRHCRSCCERHLQMFFTCLFILFFFLKPVIQANELKLSFLDSQSLSLHLIAGDYEITACKGCSFSWFVFKLYSRYYNKKQGDKKVLRLYVLKNNGANVTFEYNKIVALTLN